MIKDLLLESEGKKYKINLSEFKLILQKNYDRFMSLIYSFKNPRKPKLGEFVSQHFSQNHCPGAA